MHIVPVKDWCLLVMIKYKRPTSVFVVILKGCKFTFVQLKCRKIDFCYLLMMSNNYVSYKCLLQCARGHVNTAKTFHVNRGNLVHFKRLFRVK